LGQSYVDIIISPPSLESLRDRLQARGEDAPEVIEQRLANAQGEMARAREYQHRIINDQLDQAYAELHAIIQAEHDRTPC
jgi:guanylate kinase